MLVFVGMYAWLTSIVALCWCLMVRMPVLIVLVVEDAAYLCRMRGRPAVLSLLQLSSAGAALYNITHPAATAL
jgi:NCAIR mutase (PurE)-related protein